MGHLPLAGAEFAQCSMLGSPFVQCRMRPLILEDVDFTLAGLGGSDLRAVDLSGCRLSAELSAVAGSSTG